MSESTGKKAERKIREWLDRPEEGYYCYRLPDQVSGWAGSCNPCDFFLFKSPEFYLIESKATEHDRFEYSAITEYQYESLLEASKVAHTHGYVAVLFYSYKRAFIIDIQDIDNEIAAGRKSINIKKISKWKIPYLEIKTIPSRKELLDYQKQDNVL